MMHGELDLDPELVETLDSAPFPEVGDPRKRAYLVAFAATASHKRACQAAGVSKMTPYSPYWRGDPAFLRAKDEAFVMAGEAMEEEARRRAVHGVKRYQFTKDGDPIRHPHRCECGHDARVHPRAGDGPRPCEHPDGCDCQDFIGEAYFEHEYSDTLLKFLLTGALPDRYSKRLELRGLFANLDLNRLPDPLLARIAAGENPAQVIIEAASEAGTYPAQIMGLTEKVEGEDPGEAPGMDEYEPPEGQL